MTAFKKIAANLSLLLAEWRDGHAPDPHDIRHIARQIAQLAEDMEKGLVE